MAEEQVVTTVDEGMPTESVQDDAAQAQDGEELSALLEQSAQTDQQEQQDKQQSEPGWMKRRIGKVVDKAVAEAEARMQAKYEAMLAPMREQMLEREAQDLVRSGEFRSLDRAKEYLSLKRGGNSSPTQSQAAPAQQEQEHHIDPAIQAKADLLAAQAHKINASRGIDVMAAYNADENIQRKIASGEWDFYDVAENMNKKTPPSPVRSANGARAERVSIADMTPEQFKRLNDNLAKGKRYKG